MALKGWSQHFEVPAQHQTGLRHLNHTLALRPPRAGAGVWLPHFAGDAVWPEPNRHSGCAVSCLVCSGHGPGLPDASASHSQAPAAPSRVRGQELLLKRRSDHVDGVRH